MEHLRTLISNCEGPRSQDMWNDLMKAVEKEADSSNQFARQLKSITSAKLGHFLSANEKGLSTEKEQDDARWRHLCDAARTEMKADAKYRQSTAQTAKARERIRSVDNGTGVTPNQNQNEKASAYSPQKNVNRATSKFLGNMLSILPDGGEQAMKIMTADTRRAVVERNLQEADEKETRGKQALDHAIASKSKAMGLYKEKAEALVEKYRVEEMSGWEDLKAAVESLVSSVEMLRKTRCEPVAQSLSKVGDKPLAMALLDVQEWTKQLAENVSQKHATSSQEEGGKDAATSGFMLNIPQDESASTIELLSLAGVVKSFSFEMEAGSTPVEEKENSSSVHTDTRDIEKQLSIPSLGIMSEGEGNVDINEDARSENEVSSSSFAGDAKAARWLHKSFSTPLPKTDFKRGFRKLNSNVSEKSDLNEAPDSPGASLGSPLRSLPSNLPLRGCDATELDCFVRFWPDFGDASASLGLLASYACAFLPKDYNIENMGSIEHGRLFISPHRLFFLAWKGKKAIVTWSSVVGVTTGSNIFGLAEDTLVVSAHKGDKPTTLNLGCFYDRDEALQTMEALLAYTKKAQLDVDKDKSGATAAVGSTKSAIDAKPVADDEVLKKMDKLLSRTLRNVSISRFYDVVWSDEKKTSDDSFYARWLKDGGCFDVDIGAWEFPENGAVGGWCQEKYTQKRVVKFKFKRKSHLYMG